MCQKQHIFHRKKVSYMKKTLSLILVIVLCLSLCACSDGKGQNDSDIETTPVAPVISLIGEWKSLSGSTITFYEGGLGYAPAGDSLEWSFHSETSQYVITYQGRSFNITADTEDGVRFVFFSGMKFYHGDDIANVNK